MDGKLIEGVKERLEKVSELLEIHILTADTFGKAKKELEGLPCKVLIIEPGGEDVKKEEYMKKLGPDKVIAIGNGNNDRRMLKAAKIGIAVVEGEGCSLDAITSADIVTKSINDALDLILNPKRIYATLRV